jgi:hypothetical protein
MFQSCHIPATALFSGLIIKAQLARLGALEAFFISEYPAMSLLK